MTPQFKTGDWAKTRDGDVVGPIVFNDRGMIVHPQDGSSLTPSGHWLFRGGETDRDLIAVVEPPQKLPEPIETQVSAFNNGLFYYPCANQRVAAHLTNGKIYRVRIEFLEEVK